MGIILLGLKPEAVPAAVLERVRELQPDARVVVTDTDAEIEPLLAEIEIAAGHFPIQWLSRAGNLRWYQQWGAGTDWLLRNPEAAQKDFMLTNASGVHAVPISEHILAFMLAFARRLPQAFAAQQESRWERDGNLPAFELCGKTMLLVGVGAIGKRTAQIADALGMRVLGVRRDPSKVVPGIQHMYGPEQMDEALGEADIVVLTMPLTNETRNMFNAQVFERMKPTAYLINIGRGGTVDEPALVRALQEGKIAGAGLDVFATEPLPSDSPLWEMPNVIITGHYSGETPLYDQRALEIFLDNLDRYTQNRPMRNLVDKQRGY